MAAIASATLSPATFAAAVTITSRSRAAQGRPNVNFVSGLNSYGGLKAQNNVVSSLTLPVCTEQSFAKFSSSLKYEGPKSNHSGGAHSSTCNSAGEIFRVAATINGLTLVGVAVGFVLLRIEAFVEESE